MAFFWTQRQRLLRENWTAPSLAEEIFAMMAPDVPMTTNAPVSINLNSKDAVAPVTLGNFSDGSMMFQFKRPDGSNGGNLAFNAGQFIFTDPNGKRSTVGGGGGGTTVPVWG